MSELVTIDYIIIVISLVFVFSIAIYGTMKKKQDSESNQEDSANAFFLAGKTMPWYIIAASLFASNIGTEHFVGQTGVAASKGLTVGLYEWTAAYLILLLGWIFAPVYLRCQLITIPEYLEKRFNKHCRYLFVIVTMVAYVLSKIGSTLYAGAIVLEVITGLNLWQSTPLILIATAAYTAAGGLTAVMLTDTLQMVIFLVGGIVGSIISLNLVGGINSLFDKMDSFDMSEFNHLFRPANDRDYPGVGLIIALPILSLWYWCIDQEMAQRVLSGKNLPQVRLGTASAALLKLVPVFITVFPGIAARALFELCIRDPDDARYANWCGTDLDDQQKADKAYPLLVLYEFPTGVKGLMVSSFLAAMMSSLSSVYNSASTIFTFDIYERFYNKQGKSSSAHLVFVGRVITVILTIFTFLWLPVIQRADRGLYIVGSEAISHLSPTIISLFICGLFIKRTNANGALIGFIVSLFFGITRMILFFSFQDTCDEQTVGERQILTAQNWFICLNFNYFAIILITLSILMIVLISLFSPPPSEIQTNGLMAYEGWFSNYMFTSMEQMSEVQLTNVKYDKMENNAQDNVDENKQFGPVVSSRGESNSMKKFLDVENGYSPHIMSVIAFLVITIMIIVYH